MGASTDAEVATQLITASGLKPGGSRASELQHACSRGRRWSAEVPDGAPTPLASTETQGVAAALEHPRCVVMSRGGGRGCRLLSLTVPGVLGSQIFVIFKKYKILQQF